MLASNRKSSKIYPISRNIIEQETASVLENRSKSILKNRLSNNTTIEEPIDTTEIRRQNNSMTTTEIYNAIQIRNPFRKKTESSPESSPIAKTTPISSQPSSQSPSIIEYRQLHTPKKCPYQILKQRQLQHLSEQSSPPSQIKSFSRLSNTTPTSTPTTTSPPTILRSLKNRIFGTTTPPINNSSSSSSSSSQEFEPLHITECDNNMPKITHNCPHLYDFHTCPNELREIFNNSEFIQKNIYNKSLPNLLKFLKIPGYCTRILSIRAIEHTIFHHLWQTNQIVPSYFELTQKLSAINKSLFVSRTTLNQLLLIIPKLQTDKLTETEYKTEIMLALLLNPCQHYTYFSQKHRNSQNESGNLDPPIATYISAPIDLFYITLELIHSHPYISRDIYATPTKILYIVFIIVYIMTIYDDKVSYDIFYKYCCEVYGIVAPKTYEAQCDFYKKFTSMMWMKDTSPIMLFLNNPAAFKYINTNNQIVIRDLINLLTSLSSAEFGHNLYIGHFDTFKNLQLVFKHIAGVENLTFDSYIPFSRINNMFLHSHYHRYIIERYVRGTVYPMLTCVEHNTPDGLYFADFFRYVIYDVGLFPRISAFFLLNAIRTTEDSYFTIDFLHPIFVSMMRAKHESMITYQEQLNYLHELDNINKISTTIENIYKIPGTSPSLFSYLTVDEAIFQATQLLGKYSIKQNSRISFKKFVENDTNSWILIEVIKLWGAILRGGKPFYINDCMECPIILSIPIQEIGYMKLMDFIEKTMVARDKIYKLKADFSV